MAFRASHHVAVAGTERRRATAAVALNPLIARLRLLTPLSDEELEALSRAAGEVRYFTADTDLVSEGARPERLHIMLEGWACRYKLLPDGRRQITTLLLPGDLCDLDALLVRRLDYSVLALTACSVADLDREAVLELAELHRGIGRALTWLAFVENAILTQWYACIGRSSARDRLAHLLCELLMRLSAVGRADGNSYALPLTQEEIADVLGLTSVHVNRTLRSLRADGLIELRDQRLTIRDWEGLKTVAGFRPNYLQLTGMRQPSAAQDEAAEPFGAGGPVSDGSAAR